MLTVNADKTLNLQYILFMLGFFSLFEQFLNLNISHNYKLIIFKTSVVIKKKKHVQSHFYEILKTRIGQTYFINCIY